MKSRRLLLSTALCILLLTSFHSYSQVQTARPISISGTCGGYYEYLPQGYNSNTWQSYPLIVAVHGIGELGNGTSDLPNLLNCWTSIPRLIANGGFPSSFNVGGQNFSFIVISPQFNRWPYASDVNAVVDYAVQNYRVDQSRIYVTGLSMGGGSVWDFAGNYPTKAAAVVPVCGAASSDPTRASAIANAKLAVWATHNQDDPTVSVSNTTGWVNLINQYGGNIISTIFPVSGHDAWTKTYDPNFTQNGVNIYQWMLQHQKGNSSTTPTNQPPVVNAGNNQTITLPQNSATLTGTASDADGSISSYLWTQTSGPSTAAIASASAASTTVSNLVQGVYIFNLKVTDNGGATANSTVTIAVTAGTSNATPGANAGANQIITLPQNSTSLNGSGTDTDGYIAFYEWSQTSGPSQASFSSLYSANPVVSGLVQGSYVFTLKVTDNSGATATSSVTITVNAAPNQVPTVSAGSNQTITLPQNSVTLSGTASDADGSIASYQWSQTSGPSTANIVSASSASSVVNNLVQGSYVFTLKVTDNSGATATSSVTITVNAAPNQVPTVSAGSNQTITLPQNSVTLSGTASDADGSIASYQWSQTSGPSTANIVSASSASSVVNNLVQGSYVFTLKVTDNSGATATSSVTITVNAAPNQVPTVSAGSNQTITLPQNSVTLSGTASDADGSIASYQWSQTSGPSTANIVSASSASSVVNNLVQGSYVFTLKVTDNSGATATSSVTITVNAAPNQVPTVSAGSNQTITLPQNSVTLSGTASDADGSIASYQWSQTSGPSTANIVSASSASSVVNNLVQGSYVFTLKVTDNSGATATSSVTITVNAAPNQVPTVSAGSNQTITLPQNSVTLSGTASDADGSIASYQWSQTSGPSTANIVSASSASSVVNNLVQGSYVFTLKVTDNSGATATSSVTITVNAAPNQVPTVSAGSNQTITLPQNSVTLSGTASDADGSIASYQWSQTSGPSKAIYSSPSPSVLSIRNLSVGVYTFRLTVIDNSGATAWSEVDVTVVPNPTNQSTASLYPNPATDVVYLRIDAVTLQTNSLITIVNSAGNTVYNEKFIRTDFRVIKEVNVSTLPRGTYFLTITTDINSTKTLSFIKQ